MKWLRLYDDLIDDPKILRLPIGSRWFYICLMCVSSKQNDRGTLPSLEEIAIHLRVRRAKAEEIVDELTAAGLIEEDIVTHGLRIHGWHKRQFKSDDVTPRVETFRKRRGNVAGNGDVTPRARDSESESDTETEEEPPLTPPAQGGRRKGKKPPFALPDWVPAEEWDAFVEMRRSIRAPLTDRAKTMAVNELADLKAAGQDAGRVLSQSVMKSWRGLFAVSEPAAASKPAEEPLNYHVCPPDSPYREHERQVRAKLFALFGGEDPQGGSPAAAEPGGGVGRPGIVPAG